MELLQTAKDRLSSSYLGTVQNGFHAYLKTLLCDEPGGILISPDLEIQLERYGEARELAYFSAGYTDTMMLCMRLALIDALFQKEPPFIILDDPFVNLDEKHTERALQLLEKLSQQRQIIYLVCNGSRC
jgi:DNA repair exonuclease SbcCD ATPase subunit